MEPGSSPIQGSVSGRVLGSDIAGKPTGGHQSWRATPAQRKDDVIRSIPQSTATQRYQLVRVYPARFSSRSPEPWASRIRHADWWEVMVFIAPWAIVVYLAVALTSFNFPA